jgi:hypothetical protein
MKITRFFVFGFLAWLALNLILLPLITIFIVESPLRDEFLLATLFLLPVLVNAGGLVLLWRLRPQWLTGALVGLGLLLLTVYPVWFCITAAMGLNSS